MTTQFNVFGVPDGFELHGMSKDNQFFQGFYIGAEKDEPLKIVKRPDGRLAYLFLKNEKVISGIGRAGSFFGFAITLKQGEYFNDTQTVKLLFNAIYNQIFANPKNGILIKNDYGNTVYQVTTFKSPMAQNLIETAVKAIETNAHLLELTKEEKVKNVNDALNTNNNIRNALDRSNE
ncbi:MAG: hypothetical protein ACOX7D_01775 [Alphaproteobacteria bacterium]|jgi:hypothetical protein